MPPSPPLLRRVLALFVATLALGRASRASDPSPAGSSPPDACSGTFDASVDARAASCATISGTLLVTARVLRAFTAASPSGGTLRRVDGDVLVRDNHLERSLNDAFPALRSVGGSVVLDRTALVYLAAFPALLEVGGDVLVTNNANLLALRGPETGPAFRSLRSVGGAVRVAANAHLRSLDGFENVRRAGAVLVESNPRLEAFAVGPRGEGAAEPPRPRWKPPWLPAAFDPPFGRLERVETDARRVDVIFYAKNASGARPLGVVLADNPALVSVRDAFRSLSLVRGSVAVSRNPSLVTIDRSFPTLREIVRSPFEGLEGGSASFDACDALAHARASFGALRVVEGDVAFANLPRLKTLPGGSFNALARVGGRFVVSNVALASLAPFFSLASVGGDVALTRNPEMRSLDGLQNLREVGGAVETQGLEGNFGRCGRITRRGEVSHACYTRAFRFCQPLFAGKKTLGILAAADDGSRSATPGWYECVPSLATALVETPELRTTAALAEAAGLLEGELQTPSAGLTVFAPTDVAWLRAVGRAAEVARRAGGKAAASRVVAAHCFLGARRLKTFRAAPAALGGRVVVVGDPRAAYAHTLAPGLAVRVANPPGSIPTQPVLATRCAANPGVGAACAPTPTRKVALEPVRWWVPGEPLAPREAPAGEDVALLEGGFAFGNAFGDAFGNASDAFAYAEDLEAAFDAFAAARANAEDGDPRGDPVEDPQDGSANDGEGSEDAGSDDEAYGDGAPEDAPAAPAADQSSRDAAFAAAAAVEWVDAHRAAHPTAARVVLADVALGNGVLHAVDAPLAPLAMFEVPAHAHPPPDQSSSSSSAAAAAAASAGAWLATPPPPAPGVAAAPPPTLIPTSAYWTARPPPPMSSVGGPFRSPPPPDFVGAGPPPPGGGAGGSCVARDPDICGLCDYTYQDAAAGVCCCDEACVASGDCCADFAETCGGALRGGAPGGRLVREREET